MIREYSKTGFYLSKEEMDDFRLLAIQRRTSGREKLVLLQKLTLKRTHFVILVFSLLISLGLGNLLPFQKLSISGCRIYIHVDVLNKIKIL